MTGTSTTERRGFGSLRQRGNVWYIRYRIGEREHWERAGSLRQAEKLLERRRVEHEDGRLTAPDARRVGFADLAELVRTDYRVKGHRSLDTLERALKHLAAAFGDHRALAITTDRVSAYESDRLDEGAARATVNKELAALRRAFRLAVRAGRLPLSAVPAISTPQPDNARTGFFERAEFEAVRAALPEALRAVATFAYLTGWRRGEILNLRWRDVDLAAGMVRLEPGTTKNREGRVFPFGRLPELETLIRQQREATSAVERATGSLVPWVFHRDGKPIKSYDVAWRAACQRAGLVGHIMHDFRRTAVRNLERAGVPRSVAMQLTGHKTEAVYRRYAIVAESDLREGVEKLAVLHSAKQRDRRTVVPLKRAAAGGVS